MLLAFEIPWAGLGALLMGVGSFFSGYAAYRTATRSRDEPEPEDRASDH